MIYMHFPDRLCFVLINLSLYYLFPSLLHSVDTLCLAYTAVTLYTSHFLYGNLTLHLYYLDPVL